MGSRTIEKGLDDPWRHHYLPEFYLKRWAEGGEVWRFTRPRGADYPVEAKLRSIRGVGYERHLYALPRPMDPRNKQVIEKRLLKPIDDRGAKSLLKVEAGERGAEIDKVGLLQFVLSLIHRTPGRIDYLQDELKKRIIEDSGICDLDDEIIRHSTLRVFVDLASSPTMLAELMKFKVFVITVKVGAHSLLTSDRPAMLSVSLTHAHGFIMVPIGPERLLILARDSAVPDAFSGQDPKVLVRGINDAVVRQAEGLVVGNKFTDHLFIEKRLNRTGPAGRGEDNGLIRWSAPL